jgi:tetratricopeptide (TPR) repeat protein
MSLADAQQRASRPDDARASLEKAMALEVEDWTKVNAALIFRRLGDLARAGELARSALPTLAQRLARLSATTFGEGDVWWSEKLGEAWRLTGEAALAAGDLAVAERYLDAAWRLGFTAEAAWALGEVREKQGRLAEAVELWGRAALIPTAQAVLPADRQARIQAACRKLPPPPAPAPASETPKGLAAAVSKLTSCPMTADGGLMDLRAIRVPGLALADQSATVLVLADAEGRVARVAPLAGSRTSEFARQLEGIRAVQVPSLQPDGEPFKSVRRALLACSATSACMLLLGMPGAELDASELEQGSVRVERVEPAGGAQVAPGQTVKVVTSVHYEIRAPRAFLALAATDLTGEVLSGQTIESVDGGSRDATIATTFTVPASATEIAIIASVYPVGGKPHRGVEAGRYKVKAP